MKRLLLILFLATGISTNLPAQNKPGDYTVAGYQGKDTLNLGTVSADSKEKFILNLGNYRGTVRLVPTDTMYGDVVKHYEAISQINSQEKFEAAKAYVRDSLPFDILYSSGIWREYIQQWVGFYANTNPSSEAFAGVFVPEVRKILDRTIEKHSLIAAVLTKDLIDFFEQYGLDAAAENIAAYSLGLDLPEEGKHGEIARRLVAASKLMNNKAPALRKSTGEALEIGNQGKALLFFYESGCHNCEAQLEELKKHYNDLQKKGVKVLSISADEDQTVFEYHSKTFPWLETLCDQKGFKGENFMTYGVASTPTIYIVDEKGIITGRYAHLSETGLIIP